MRIHSFFRLTLILVLALFPILTASGKAPLNATNASTGHLSFIQAVYDTGLEGATSIALSPDDQYLYVASSGDHAVTVFHRHDASGKLTFVEVKRDGVDGANELLGAYGVAVSPDGKYVYVASWVDDSLTVFSRDSTTGKLNFVEAHKDETGGIVSLNGASGVVVSPDNKHVYVASRDDSTVSSFSRDMSTGALTFNEAEGVASGLDATYSVAISPDGKHVYAANQGNDRVTVFGRNSSTGYLNYLSSVQDGADSVDGLDGAIHLTVSPDGANLYVAGSQDNAVAVFERNSSTGALDFIEAEFDDTDGVKGIGRAYAVAVSHNGANVYVAGYDDHAVAVFTRSPTDGALSYSDVVRNNYDDLYEMDKPRGITLDQDDEHVYVASFNFGAVEVFDRDSIDGELTIVEEQQSGDGLEGVVGLAVSSYGCVYAAGAKEDKVSFFTRDATTGMLTYEDNRPDGSPDGLDGAVGVTVSQDGWYIYVASYYDNAVVAFKRVPYGCDYMDTVATYKDILPIDGLDGARALALSPDDSLLYVASEDDDALAVFDRDPDTGELTFKQSIFDTSPGIDGLNGAYSVAVSPDGINIYVTGFYDNAVAVFRWTGGSLGFEGVVKDAVDSVDGLWGPNSVVVSPDGSYVYVASRWDDTVAYFWRNPSSGMLDYRGLVRDGVNEVDGLDGARGIAISPDGKQIYVASQYDDALAVFNRNADDGSLDFVAAYKNGNSSVNGINTADGIAVSPDGATIYVAGYDDNAIAVFARFRAFLPVVQR